MRLLDGPLHLVLNELKFGLTHDERSPFAAKKSLTAADNPSSTTSETVRSRSSGQGNIRLSANSMEEEGKRVVSFASKWPEFIGG